LYRVNRNNEFNVPFGNYKNPTICDEENLTAASTILQDAEIIAADFDESERYISKHCFVYLDPPYRPISTTASFTSYAKGNFSEEEQIRLANYCERIKEKGARFLLSNSAPKNPNDHFFDKYYKGFNRDSVRAIRVINCNGEKRGATNEILVTNY
jgi:DNA adenine methylase